MYVYFFLAGLMVSTTWVLGLLTAVFTGVKRPVEAFRPIFMLSPPSEAVAFVSSLSLVDSESV